MTATATYREVFSVSAFRVLFASRAIAIAADSLRIMALSVLVYALTQSALLSAITFGVGFLPQVVGGMMFASLADRLRPRALITTGYVIEGAAAVALAAIPMPVGVSLAIVASVGVFVPVFGGASARLVAEVLSGDAYVLGRSLTSMSAGAAQLLGLAFGGLAVAAVGPQRALLVSAACHAVSALTVRFGLSDLDPPPTAPDSIVGETWRTNTALLRDTRIRRLLLIQWLPSALVVGGEALVVAYAERRGFPAGSAGLLLACAPAGMLAGHFVVGRFVSPPLRTRLVGPLILLLGLPTAALALHPPMWGAGLLLLLTGAGFAYSLGLQRIFLDAIPQTRRGQAFALLSTGLMTLQGLGPVVFGTLAQVTGVRVAMAGAGLACAASAALWRRNTR